MAALATIERADADFLREHVERNRRKFPSNVLDRLHAIASRIETATYENHANGRPKWAPDGTLLDDNGQRSIFDDVDK